MTGPVATRIDAMCAGDICLRQCFFSRHSSEKSCFAPSTSVPANAHYNQKGLLELRSPKTVQSAAHAVSGGHRNFVILPKSFQLASQRFRQGYSVVSSYSTSPSGGNPAEEGSENSAGSTLINPETTRAIRTSKMANLKKRCISAVKADATRRIDSTMV